MTRKAKTVLLSRAAAAVGVVATLLCAPDAGAICDQSITSVSNSEFDMFDVYFSPSGGNECTAFATQFFQWEPQAYTVQSDDWSDRGFFDACNPQKEFPKHWSAAYIITYLTSHVPAAGDPPGLILARAFHGREDYKQLTESAENNWHDEFISEADDDRTKYGHFDQNCCSDNEVFTDCPLYDAQPPMAPNSGTTFDNPSSRGSDLVHESFHAWGENHGISLSGFGGHEVTGNFPQRGPGNCRNPSCDNFYPHVSAEFLEGDLQSAGFPGFGPFAPPCPSLTDPNPSALNECTNQGGTCFPSSNPFPGDPFAQTCIGARGLTYHSVYQAHLEYLCDLADYADDGVPYSVREDAATQAKYRASIAFVNRVPFFCGSTRPFWGPDIRLNSGTPVPPCLNPSLIQCTGTVTTATCPVNSNGCFNGCCIPTCADTTSQCSADGSGNLSCPQNGAQCFNPSAGCCEILH